MKYKDLAKGDSFTIDGVHYTKVDSKSAIKYDDIIMGWTSMAEVDGEAEVVRESAQTGVRKSV